MPRTKKRLSAPANTSSKDTKRKGFSLIEILIVVTILALILVALLISMRTQLSRSRDARRKGDVDKIKIAFENYYNDNSCYPSAGILNECNGSQLAPYLNAVPCDPSTREAYTYIPNPGDECGGYRLFAKLENESDPVIAELGCDSECGCGFGAANNYGVSSGVSLASDSCTDPTPQPSAAASSAPASSVQPSPSSAIPIYEYACSTTGTCKEYEKGHPFLVNCPVTWDTPAECIQQCDNNPNNQALRCAPSSVQGPGGADDNYTTGGQGQF